MMIQKALHRIRPKAGLDHGLLYYSFRNIGLQKGFDQYFTGATIKHLPGEKLAKVEVPIPPLPIQRRIAGILSAYDDLIENSQRRIKILEEMARRLYREWFVYFRFPGHEDCRFVESPLGEIPEGWEVKAFSELAQYLNGYAFKPGDWGSSGKPIIKIRELKSGVSFDTPRNDGSEISGKFHVIDGDILFSWSADLDAYLWSGGEGLLNQHLFNVLPIEGYTRCFCFHALKEVMPRFRALSLGATMHHIKRSALDQVFAAVPPAELRQRLDELVEPIHREIIVLAKYVSNLRRTRDLLLPRLLSGQIDVEALAEPVLPKS
jgi:type I restriction enzyme S subunit